MLIYIFALLALIGAALTATFSPMSWWWLAPAALGYFVSVIFTYLLAILIWSLFINKSTPVEGNVSPIYKFLTIETISALLTMAGVKLTVVGEEKLPCDRRFMLVSNHISRFDPMVCFVRFRKQPLIFVSKPENFKIPIAGSFIHKCKFLAINRDNPRAAIKTLHTCADYIRSGELSVGIYPEGMRSKTGELLPFHDGIFKIARDTSAPIVVATLRGTDKIAKNFPLRKSPVELRILEVIEPEQYAGKRTSAISAMAYEIISDDLADENKNPKENKEPNVCKTEIHS